MKKRYLLVGSLAFSLVIGKAQPRDTTEFKVNATEVEVLYNQYIQDGDHSAVTGGIGTEKLTVYGPYLSLKKYLGRNAYTFQMGSDIISSASTDNIDFVVSSASKVDTRYYSNVYYTRSVGNNNLTLNAGMGLSIESDYLSLAKYLGLSKQSKDEMQNFFLQLQIFNDDLRWGRLNPDYYRPVKLIYPEELRNSEWYDEYRRNSYNLHLGYNRILDKRDIIGLFSYLSIQNGLLETPFHRIYFNDGSLAVEQLPEKRYRASLAAQWNGFIGGHIILKNSLNGYMDNFGIRGIWLDNETILKLNYKWSLVPSIRLYTQKASTYFAPYMQHKSNEKYYTSDYDLSKFQSVKLGLGFNYHPYLTGKIPLQNLNLKYLFYRQSNGLKSHVISLLMNFRYKAKVKKKRK